MWEGGEGGEVLWPSLWPPLLPALIHQHLQLARHAPAETSVSHRRLAQLPHPLRELGEAGLATAFAPFLEGFFHSPIGVIGRDQAQEF